MKLWPGWLVVLAGACTFGAHASSATTTLNSSATPNSFGTALRSNATIVRVIDGDTVDAKIMGHEERIRLIGIDTPETVKPHTPVQCYGPDASAFTKHTLPPGTLVMIVRDAEARDDYGRLLGYVYRSSDDLFVNLELATLGFARPLTISPNDAHALDFVAAATAAQAAHRGLWGQCTG